MRPLPSWLPLTGALLVGLLVRAIPAQDEAALVSSFKAAFRKPNTAKTLADKREALRALSTLDSAGVAQVLIQGFCYLEQEAEPLRAERRALLFRDGGSARLWRLRVRLQPVRDLQRNLLAALRRLRSKDAVQAMLEALLRSGKSNPFGLRLVLAERVVDLSEGGLNLVTRAVEASARKGSGSGSGSGNGNGNGRGKSRGKSVAEGNVILLLQLVGSLGRRAQSTAAWATSHLQHHSEAVRRQAARSLATLCWPGSIEPLIDRLDKEHGVTREQILDTLVVLTSQGPGNTATAWRAWLAQSGGPYIRGEVRLGDGKAEFRKPDDRTNKKGGGTTAGTYFGIQQDGNDILYVFDASLSMRRPGDGSGGRRGGGGGRGGFRPDPNVESRWDLCRKELHRALDKLTRQKTFNLVGFADRLQVFSPKMLRATPKNIARAHQWIDKVRLEFQTNIHDALELAFYIAGRGAKDRYYPVVVDTIFFLSDGAPTKPINADGRVDGPGVGGRGGGAGPGTGAGGGGRIQRDNIGQILAAVRRWNPLGRIVIHTIGLGLNDDTGGRGGGRGGRGGRGGGPGGGAGARNFLKRLAEQNDGRFVEPK